MEVLILLIFVSLLLAGAAVGLFVWLAGQRTFEHGDRLELLPLDDGEQRALGRSIPLPLGGVRGGPAERAAAPPPAPPGGRGAEPSLGGSLSGAGHCIAASGAPDMNDDSARVNQREET